MMSKRGADFSDDSFQKRSRLSDDFSASGDVMYQRRTSFTAHSPHGSPKGLSSAEIAADFKDALQDLTTTDRFQISNLTLIAKESTEHAAAISQVLEEHIRRTPPTRKLPALYVLDSIVKNVGTPFTIYLAPNLYRTFMEAYSLVNSETRKKMADMLVTWVEPIPGSVENRPVFPKATTKPIENALIKAKTVFLQQEQEHQRSQQRQAHALPPRPMMPPQQNWVRSGTPQNSSQPYTTPVPPTTPQFQYGLPQSPYPPQQQPQMPYGMQNFQPPPQPMPMSAPPPPPSHSYNLAALLQVAGTYTPQPTPTPAFAPPPLPPVQAPVPPPPTMFAGLEALFNLPAFQQATQQHPSQQQPLAQLPQIPNLASYLNQQSQHAASPFPYSQASAMHTSNLSTVAPNVQMNATIIQLTSASLKIPRPDLLASLYQKQPSQCASCGRRFPLTDLGRARKVRHLDAHFRTNKRMADAQRSGVSRSWYVDEMDWIKSREVDDADEDVEAASKVEGTGAESGGIASLDGNVSNPSGQGQSATSVKKEHYVKAPVDAAVAHHACPICQEEFKTVWHDGEQEWVWMDATVVREKTYHASCVLDMTKDRGSDGMKSEVKVEA